MHAYELQRNRRSQSIKILINQSGQIVVRAPSDCPVFFIDRFVKQHQDWIDQHLAQVRARTPVPPPADQLMVFGQQYHLQKKYSLHESIGVMIQGDQIIVHPVEDNEKSVQKALTTFYKATAEKYIVPRTHELAKMMKITFSSITLRAQKTRWGSCSSLGNLNFNWRLVHVPPVVIDYVIIHELAHRQQMNHSAQFWEIVRKFDPEYLKHRGWLKRQGMSLG